MFENINDRMIKFIESKKNVISKIFFGIILIIPIIITFLIAIFIFKNNDENLLNPTNILKDKGKDIYGSRDDEGTLKTDMEENTVKKLEEIANDASK